MAVDDNAILIWVLILLFTFVFMFVRQLKHKNGKTYIQVIDKSTGHYRVIKSFRSSNTQSSIERLVEKANRWIKAESGIIELDFEDESTKFNNLLNNIVSHKLVGIDLVLGKIFDEIGFNQIEDQLFRDLVLYRLVYPKSKLKTTEYLYRYEQKEYSEDEIYRYLDKLNDTQKEIVQNISYQHTKTILGGEINIVFYDVTTIYFEIDNEDELRKTGFPKKESIKTLKLF